MKILVTGATGFLGSHVAEQLVTEGHQVVALVRRTSDTSLLDELGIETRLASLETGEGLDDSLADVDAVVHSAGLVKARTPEEFKRVNVRGTENLLAAALRSRPGLRRFVYVSSLGAPGFRDGRPCADDEPPRPVTHYSRSKLEGEQAVLAATEHVPVSVIRPPAIYGPRDKEILSFFQMAQQRVMLYVDDADNRVSLIYGPDCARAIRDMIVTDHPSGRVYYVDDGRTYSYRELGQTLQDLVGKRALELQVPLPLAKTVALGSEAYGAATGRAVMLTRDKLNELGQPAAVCHGEAIRRDLGWQPEVQLEEGARRTVQWYREQGWL